MTSKFGVLARVRGMLTSALLATAAPVAVMTLSAPVFAVEPDIPQTIVTEADALAVLIRQKAAESTQAGVEREDRQALARFYQERGGKPAWIDAKGLTSRARDVAAEIRNAGDWGLQASAFELPELAASASVEQSASAELKLSQAVLKYARHARGGRFNPSDLTKNLDVTAQLYDPKSVIASVSETDGPAAYLRRLHPQNPQFEKLRQAYLQMRSTGRSGPAVVEQTANDTPSIQIPAGPRLRPGQTHPHIALLRQRLGVPAQEEPEFFDDELAAAVAENQRSRGVETDRILSTGLRNALNATVRERSAKERTVKESTGSTAKLLANMERWRYVPEDMGRLHVWVNVPEFMFRVVKDGKVIHSERIVAGKNDTQTAIFSASMQEIIFNPHWNVPLSIKVKEIQPHLAKSPAILAKQGLRIKVGNRDIDPGSVDWGSADMRNFHFYQPSGGGNVLGIVKFAFPNKHDIYMHDTPSKSLFNSEVRTFSHGCMRVRDPRKFAEVLLREDKGWEPQRIAQALAAGGGQDENRIGLSKKIPVHVTYFTAIAGDDGKVGFRNDIYGHDQRINDALSGKPIHLIAQSDPVLIQARSVQEAQANLQQRRVQRRETQDNGNSGNFLSWLLN